jgi:hypothetical protein
LDAAEFKSQSTFYVSVLNSSVPSTFCSSKVLIALENLPGNTISLNKFIVQLSNVLIYQGKRKFDVGQ